MSRENEWYQLKKTKSLNMDDSFFKWISFNTKEREKKINIKSWYEMILIKYWEFE